MAIYAVEERCYEYYNCWNVEDLYITEEGAGERKAELEEAAGGYPGRYRVTEYPIKHR